MQVIATCFESCFGNPRRDPDYPAIDELEFDSLLQEENHNSSSAFWSSVAKLFGAKKRYSRLPLSDVFDEFDPEPIARNLTFTQPIPLQDNVALPRLTDLTNTQNNSNHLLDSKPPNVVVGSWNSAKNNTWKKEPANNDYQTAWGSQNHNESSIWKGNTSPSDIDAFRTPNDVTPPFEDETFEDAWDEKLLEKLKGFEV